MIDSIDDKNVTRAHILLAEDDVIGQIVTARVLEQAGYGVDVVNDGREALDALKKDNYDLVVMDCLMPGMDGFAATKAIRGSDSHMLDENIPVIALSALAQSGDRENCIRSGMNEFVKKPVDADVLVAAIERCLDRKNSSAELSATETADNPASQRMLDLEFMDSVIDKFLRGIPEVMAGLQQALASGDLIELGSISHKLRGAADLLEATSLSRHAKELERAGRGGELELADQLTPRLIEELKKLTAALSDG